MRRFAAHLGALIMSTQKVCDVCGSVCDGENEGIAIADNTQNLPSYSAALNPVPVTFNLSAVAGKDGDGNQRDICRKCAWVYVVSTIMPADLAAAGFPQAH